MKKEGSGRGMMKWRPFASLVQYRDYYEEMLENRKKREKPELSEDQVEEINGLLCSLKKGEEVRVTYFLDGNVRKKEGVFLRSDDCSDDLILDDLVVPFANLLSLSRI